MNPWMVKNGGRFGPKIKDASGKTSIFGLLILGKWHFAQGVPPFFALGKAKNGGRSGQNGCFSGARSLKGQKSRILRETSLTFGPDGRGVLARASLMCRPLQSQKWRTLRATSPIFGDTQKGPQKRSRFLGPLGGQKWRTLRAKWPFFENEVGGTKAKSRILPEASLILSPSAGPLEGHKMEDAPGEMAVCRKRHFARGFHH